MIAYALRQWPVLLVILALSLTASALAVLGERGATLSGGQRQRIAVVDAGHIVEFGTHDQLLARNGLYDKLHQLQTTPAAEARVKDPKVRGSFA